MVRIALTFLSRKFELLERKKVEKYLLLDCERQFLDLILSVSFGLLRAFDHKRLLFIVVVKFGVDKIIVVIIPVSLGCLCPQNVNICFCFLFMVLQIPVRHHIVLSLRSLLYALSFDQFGVGGWWSLFRCVEVVLAQIYIADDVVVCKGVFFGPKVPRLFFGVVFPLLQTLQFVFKVQNVICLFVA